MCILPLSFSANKMGYKKYLQAGGILDFADFMVYERRSQKEILAEKINRFHSAMISAYDSAMYYKSTGDQSMYEVMIKTSEIRAEQLGNAHKELDSII